VIFSHAVPSHLIPSDFTKLSPGVWHMLREFPFRIFHRKMMQANHAIGVVGLSMVNKLELLGGVNRNEALQYNIIDITVYEAQSVQFWPGGVSGVMIIVVKKGNQVRISDISTLNY
jgi:hypothetical protein